MNPCSQSLPSMLNPLQRDAQKVIGKFFYEMGMEINASTVHSFHRVMNASSGYDTVDGLPSSEDLKGRILQEVREEVKVDVQRIRELWASSGCSVLLDGWQNSMGRIVLHVLAACPLGIEYIQSVEITNFNENIEFMDFVLDDVLERIGVENVVQIITYTTEPWMVETGNRLVDRYKSLFWTVSDCHCIELMLEKIGRRKDIKDTLVKAKTITSFVHSDFSALKLLRDLTSVHDLVIPSKFNFLVPFLTLENLVVERENLEKVFCSTLWKTSSFGSTSQGQKVAKFVADGSFWKGANVVLNATIPLVRGLELLSDSDAPQVAYIYETMDQVKECIADNFKGVKSHYQPFWDDIDEIWNNYLHSPLHAAGYLLNPKLRHGDNFSDDSEVRSGICSCIARMSENFGLVCSQLQQYEMGVGAFQQGIICGSNISPVKWWQTYGGEQPELQRLAIRVLSQTPNGAIKYNLNRSLTERCLPDQLNNPMNPIELARLADILFVSFNLHLQKFRETAAKDLPCDEINPRDDWVINRKQLFRFNRGWISWTDLARKERQNSVRRRGDSGSSCSNPK